MLNIKHCFCFFYAGIDEIQITRGKVYRKALQAVKQNRRLTEKKCNNKQPKPIWHIWIYLQVGELLLFYNFVTTILVSMEHLFAAMAKNWARDTWEL